MGNVTSAAPIGDVSVAGSLQVGLLQTSGEHIFPMWILEPFKVGYFMSPIAHEQGLCCHILCFRVFD